MKSTPEEHIRKIIHIDMDCFYAAIEIRDNPNLKDKPVAVGGPSHHRGVICTCNYIARKYGVRSAMPTATATRLCPDLILLPVDMQKYKAVAKRIQTIFFDYTDLVEPLALDEAYLDVSDTKDYQGSATLLAEAIRKRILDSENLTASAGVAPNKFLAKIASGWKKPNGLFVIKPSAIADFVRTLPVTELFGVGKVTAKKLQQQGLDTCADLQKISFIELTEKYGKLGQYLYHQCRGVDDRVVMPNRLRKSLSVERTFSQDINNVEQCYNIMQELYVQLVKRVKDVAGDIPLSNQYIKIKFNDFKQTTAEVMCDEVDFDRYKNLFANAYERQQKPIRLLGLGVHFASAETDNFSIQGSLF